jgi:type I restriction-modification system DNA methylase subunit
VELWATIVNYRICKNVLAAGSGKKAGEFYTPQQISDILSTIRTSPPTTSPA